MKQMILYGIMVKSKVVGIDPSLNVYMKDLDFGKLDYLPLYYDKEDAEQLLKYIKENHKYNTAILNHAEVKKITININVGN